jgi:hypothetical protein
MQLLDFGRVDSDGKKSFNQFLPNLATDRIEYTFASSALWKKTRQFTGSTTNRLNINSAGA